MTTRIRGDISNIIRSGFAAILGCLFLSSINTQAAEPTAAAALDDITVATAMYATVPPEY